MVPSGQGISTTSACGRSVRWAQRRCSASMAMPRTSESTQASSSPPGRSTRAISAARSSAMRCRDRAPSSAMTPSAQPSARNARLPDSATTAAIRPAGAPPLRGGRRAGMRGHDPDHRVPGPGRLGRARPPLGPRCPRAAAARRGARRRAGPWPPPAGTASTQEASLAGARPAGWPLTSPPLTPSAVRQTGAVSRPRRDRRRRPGSAHRAGTTGAIATAAFPANRHG